MRRLLLPAALIACVATVATAIPASAAPATRHCRSADLRYAFQPGMPRFFGVWHLRITGGTCATAHRVAKRWQRRFESSPTATLPRRVYGFRFRTLRPNAAQTYRLRGTRDATVVRFAYVVPNG